MKLPKSPKSQKEKKNLKAKLSHFDEAGRASMVDVSGKIATRREATASAFVELSEAWDSSRS